MAEDRQPDEGEDAADSSATSGDTTSGDTTSGDSTTPGSSPASGAGPEDVGNPLDALLRSLGAAGGSGDVNAFMQQLQSAFGAMFPAGFPTAAPGLAGAGMFSPPAAGSGVNWAVTKDIARKTVASLGADPTPNAAQLRAVREAVSIAEVWLDEASTLPRAGTTVSAWSRADWIEQTIDVWQRLVEPVAGHIADAMEGALSAGEGEGGEAAALAGMEQMLRPMLRTSGATMFGFQLGQGLGKLATEVVGATDIGLPLSTPGHIALLPTNVAEFGEGLDQTPTDVLVYLALRECARQRLFASAGWLSSQILALVERYAEGITIDTSALEDVVGQLDPSNLEEVAAKLEGGLFEPQKSPEQLATLARLETMLALVEGWVDDVVTQASARWMPAADALAETVRRARATGGPAEATFATLVGLELRPRRMRDAANLWAAVRDARGASGRDAVWSHPDLVPTSADLDDPLGFVAAGRTTAGDDFDAALAELLDAEVDDGDADPPERPA